jgi:photosystem II stability/assembly factor-like uncharacterized protein
MIPVTVRRLWQQMRHLWDNEAIPKRSVHPRRSLQLETLEDRTALTTWLPQGPAPTLNGQVGVPPPAQVTGAIQALAIADNNTVYVGAVNGGVWKTTNALAASPNWVPLTDSLPSFSIGSITVDPANVNRVLVGLGRRSSFAREGDQLLGMYFSTNAGASWTQFNQANLQNQTFIDVSVRGSVMFGASTNAGLFRSTNNGTTWTNISGSGGLPAGPALAFAADPANGTRYYVVVGGANGGIFRTNDNGTSWTNVTPTGATIGANTDNAKLSIHSNGSNNAVYVFYSNNSQAAGLFRSANQGAAWTSLDVPTVNSGMQGGIHLSLVADPTNANLCYVGGDTDLNSPPFYGNIFRVNAAGAAGSQATRISGTTSNAPHADSRNMRFAPNGVLWQVDDGGVYRASTPAGTATWTSAVGNLAVTEVHDIAYDSLGNRSIVGTQDNGSQAQVNPGLSAWTLIAGGDGGDVAIDSVTNRAANQYIRYFSSQTLLGFTRQVVNAASGAVVSTTVLNTSVITDAQFVTPIELNAINPRRIIFGGSGTIYESLDQGTTITALANSPGVNENAFFYGGTLNGVPNPELIISAENNVISIRTTAGGAFTATSALPAGAGFISDLTADPDNWRTIVAVDDNQVFMTRDGGGSWLDITGNLAGVAQLGIQSVEYIPSMPDYIAIGTRSGVFGVQMGTPTVWRQVGFGLPSVPAWDMEYNATDDVIALGTLGRGAWLLPRASQFFINPGGMNAGPADDNQTSDRATFLPRIDFGSQFIQGLTIRRTPMGLPDYDWYTSRVSNSGLLTVTGTVGSGGPLQFVLFRRDGNVLTRIGSGIQSAGGRVSLAARVTAGQQIYVLIQGVNTAPGVISQGAYDLNFRLTP